MVCWKVELLMYTNVALMVFLIQTVLNIRQQKMLNVLDLSEGVNLG